MLPKNLRSRSLVRLKKIIPGVVSTMPDKAQIAVEGAEDLYKEIHVENTLHDEDGKPVSEVAA